MLFEILVTLGASLAVPSSTQEESSWTWVLGKIQSERQQTVYREYATRMHTYYQDRGQLLGPLIAEGEAQATRPPRAVHIGPIDWFERRDWLDSAIEYLEPGAVRIAGIDLRRPRTGFYLRSLDATQITYSGLSYAGFKSIFSVPTG